MEDEESLEAPGRVWGRVVGLLRLGGLEVARRSATLVWLWWLLLVLLMKAGG